MNEQETARQVALRYLAYRPRTEAEVRRRLARAKFDADVIEVVVADLVAHDLVNDAMFSQAWVEDRAERKGLGRQRLASELARKGVDRDSIQLAMAGIPEQEALHSAVEQGLRRLGIRPPLDLSAKRRLSAFLMRRGFTGDSLEQVFANLSANTD